MPANVELLFVYGTLKRGWNNDWSRRLWHSAEFLGSATVQGRLHLITTYPGLVDSSNPANLVHGELARLDPSLLADLDAYEGSEYSRVRRPVRLESGVTVDASLYLFVESVDNRPLIPGGLFTK